MKNISIQVDDEMFRDFSVACAQTGIQKKTILIKLIGEFIEELEDAKLLKMAETRMKEFQKKKLKTISHKDAWK